MVGLVAAVYAPAPPRRLHVVAAPAYLKRRRTDVRAQLRHHACLAARPSGGLLPWRFAPGDELPVTRLLE